jgi:hypothetical protein
VRGRKGQDDQLNNGEHENNGQHRPVPEDLQEFFLQQ